MNTPMLPSGSVRNGTSVNGGDQAHQMAGKVRINVASQKLGVARPMIGDRPADVVGGRIAAHRRVDADRQPDQQTDHDRHHPELEGCRQPAQYPLFDRPVAQEGVAQRAAQEDVPQPAPILHVHRPVQSQHPLDRFTVNVADHVLHFARQRVYGIAREKTHRQEYQNRQEQEGGYQQQNAADDIRFHIVVTNGRREARGSRRPSLAGRTNAKTV